MTLEQRLVGENWHFYLLLPTLVIYMCTPTSCKKIMGSHSNSICGILKSIPHPHWWLRRVEAHLPEGTLLTEEEVAKYLGSLSFASCEKFFLFVEGKICDITWWYVFCRSFWKCACRRLKMQTETQHCWLLQCHWGYLLVATEAFQSWWLLDYFPRPCIRRAKLSQSCEEEHVRRRRLTNSFNQVWNIIGCAFVHFFQNIFGNTFSWGDSIKYSGHLADSQVFHVSCGYLHGLRSPYTSIFTRAASGRSCKEWLGASLHCSGFLGGLFLGEAAGWDSPAQSF